MDLQLNDHVVIVTGATSGIGLATVRELANEGTQVVAVARHAPDGDLLPPGTDFVAADLTAPGAATRLVEHTLNRHGRIDGLVNNAALFDTRDSFTAFDDALWDATFAMNVVALVRLTRTVITAMQSHSTGGSIVHLGSEAARMPDPTMSAYAASKAAVLSVSKSLAIEFGPAGIRSNVVSPAPPGPRCSTHPVGSVTSSPHGSAPTPIQRSNGSSVRNVDYPPERSVVPTTSPR